jgi:hypothetical protein
LASSSKAGVSPSVQMYTYGILIMASQYSRAVIWQWMHGTFSSVSIT